MESLCRVLKRVDPPSRHDPKEEDEERKMLRVSLQNIEKEKMFDEFKIRDVQNDVKTRDALLKEKQQQVDSLLPLYTENITLRDRIKDLEAKLFQVVREKQAVEARLERQVFTMGDVHQKKIAEARTKSMDTINEHLQTLRALFLKKGMAEDEDALAQYVNCEDQIRIAVGINLV
jgi:hypothetical protein